jgi:hypothetical protein
MRLQHCFSSPFWASSRGPAHISYAPCARLPTQARFSVRPPSRLGCHHDRCSSAGAAVLLRKSAQSGNIPSSPRLPRTWRDQHHARRRQIPTAQSARVISRCASIAMPQLTVDRRGNVILSLDQDWGQGGGADGRARAHHQWQLCRIYPRASVERRAIETEAATVGCAS